MLSHAASGAANGIPGRAGRKGVRHLQTKQLVVARMQGAGNLASHPPSARLDQSLTKQDLGQPKNQDRWDKCYPSF